MLSNSVGNVDSEKSESQMGFEPVTLRDLVGCSATELLHGDSVVSKGQIVVIDWNRIARLRSHVRARVSNVYVPPRVYVISRKSRHCQTWLERHFSQNENLQRKQTELNCEIYRFWRKFWKNSDSFCHQSSPVSWKAWTLPWILQELKTYSRKTCSCGQHWRSFNQIQVLNERSVSEGGTLCPLWLEIFKSLWYSVRDTL